ncbi:hypothetical protein ABKY54_000212 [Vibrio harveyi]
MGFIHYSMEQARHRTLISLKSKTVKRSYSTASMFERHTTEMATLQGSSTPHAVYSQFNVFDMVI